MFSDYGNIALATIVFSNRITDKQAAVYKITAETSKFQVSIFLYIVSKSVHDYVYICISILDIQDLFDLQNCGVTTP